MTLEDPTPLEAPEGTSTEDRLDEHRGHVGVDHFIGDLVFGANDGLITTFAIVSSVAGAELGAKAALVLGLANLLGDGVSMAAGNYLGRRSDTQVEAVRTGRVATRRGPVSHGGAMFGAFVAAGAVPLLPYLFFDATTAFVLAMCATALTLFGVGSARTLVTRQPWLSSGLEMLAVGSVAASLAFAVGWLFRSVV